MSSTYASHFCSPQYFSCQMPQQLPTNGLCMHPGNNTDASRIVNPSLCKTRTYRFYIVLHSILWVMMSWRRKEPGHQQPWYWLFWTGTIRSRTLRSSTSPTDSIVDIHGYMDGLVQQRRNSIANALELRLSCINPSMSLWGLPHQIPIMHG